MSKLHGRDGCHMFDLILLLCIQCNGCPCRSTGNTPPVQGPAACTGRAAGSQSVAVVEIG
jgi:hypothetical protein